MSNGNIPAPVKPLVAGAIRTAIHNLRLLTQEVENIGMALNADQVSPQRAIDLVEEVAPGTLGFLSPMCGLSLPRNPNAAKPEDVRSDTTEVA